MSLAMVLFSSGTILQYHTSASFKLYSSCLVVDRPTRFIPQRDGLWEWVRAIATCADCCRNISLKSLPDSFPCGVVDMLASVGHVHQLLQQPVCHDFEGVRFCQPWKQIP
jgi:hypothetical protein